MSVQCSLHVPFSPLSGRCRFKEVYFDETYLAIVMEYASQGHLSAMLKRQGKLSETDARR